MAKAVLTKRLLKAVDVKVPTFPTATLPDGRELTAGMVFTVDGEPGVFRFRYARLGEITAYGGAITGEKSDHQWRTFRPARIATIGANTTTTTLVAKAVAAMPGDYAT